MDFTEILFEIDEGVAVITLNRPEARNALAPVMRQELAHALKTVRSALAQSSRIADRNRQHMHLKILLLRKQRGALKQQHQPYR